jgi:hypothetical protein
MEADWSVEIGNDLPVIAVPWEGFVDLRIKSDSVSQIREVDDSPELAEALIEWNARTSPVFTSKCDCWVLASEEIDPLEFEAESIDAQKGIACYIDVLACKPELYASFSRHEAWVQSAVQALRKHVQPQARAEFVVRPAIYETLGDGFALTVYVAACAAIMDEAKSIFRSALKAVTAITMNAAVTAGE